MARHGMIIFAALAASIGLPSPAPSAAAQSVGVGPQYGTTHLYVAPADTDRFVAALIATIGGTATAAATAKVTPTESRTISRLVKTSTGQFSVFGFTTPVPFPFGSERTGYLVRNLDVAVVAARKAGATIVVSPFADAIGRDAVIEWPGGVMMQLYWHTVAPSYPLVGAVAENRVYVSADAVRSFVRDWQRFARATLVSDEAAADAADIGRPGQSFRRIRMTSDFGKLTLLVSDGHLPWPYGREITGHEVADLSAALARGQAAGVELMAGPYKADGREAAMVRFPGGAILELHAPLTGAP